MKFPAAIIGLIAFLSAETSPVVFGQTIEPQPNVMVWARHDPASYVISTNVPPQLTNAVSVAVGRDWLTGRGWCYALRTDGTVIQWKPHDYYVEYPTNSVIFAVASNLSDVVLINGYRSEFLCSDGTVRNWDGTPLTPYLTNIISMDLSALWVTALYVTSQGRLISSGGNVHFPDVTNAVACTTGSEWGRILTIEGEVFGWTWKMNPPVLQKIATNAQSISGEDYAILILSKNGTVSRPNFPSNIVSISSVGIYPDNYACVLSNGQVFSNGQVPPNLPFCQSISVGPSFDAAVIVPGLAVTAPTIIGSPTPANQTIASGSTFTLKIHAAGVGPLTYQWHQGTNLIAGATNAIFQVPNAQTIHSGAYKVVVTNPAGSTTSSIANVNVMTSLGIVFVPRITLSADTGATYRLESLSAFDVPTSWQLVNTVTITNNPQYYYDDSAIGFGKRFYRLVMTNSP